MTSCGSMFHTPKWPSKTTMTGGGRGGRGRDRRYYVEGPNVWMHPERIIRDYGRDTLDEIIAQQGRHHGPSMESPRSDMSISSSSEDDDDTSDAVMQDRTVQIVRLLRERSRVLERIVDIQNQDGLERRQERIDALIAEIEFRWNSELHQNGYYEADTVTISQSGRQIVANMDLRDPDTGNEIMFTEWDRRQLDPVRTVRSDQTG